MHNLVLLLLGLLSSLTLAAPLVAPVACANAEAVRNGGFEQGQDAPTYWTISGGGIRTHLFSDPTSYVIYGEKSPTVSQVLQCAQPGTPYIFSANMSSQGFDGNPQSVYQAASLDGVKIPLTQSGLKFYGTAVPKRQSPTLLASVTLATQASTGAYLDNFSLKKK